MDSDVIISRGTPERRDGPNLPGDVRLPSSRSWTDADGVLATLRSPEHGVVAGTARAHGDDWVCTHVGPAVRVLTGTVPFRIPSWDWRSGLQSISQ